MSLASSALLLPLAAGLAGCTPSPTREPGTPPPKATPAELAAWLTGAFSSARQAEEDPDEYLDVRLFAVPIWEDDADGPWLYVEQAAAYALDRPYRQRIYHLVATEDGVRSDVFELPGDPLDMAGAWRFPETFGAIDPDDLVPRAGCSIHLARTPEAYAGATEGRGCASRLRGAVYATSEVVVTPTTLTSWDRGFDEQGEQAWGATAGPYVFRRTSDL